MIHSFRKGGAPARNQNDDSGFGGGNFTPFGRGSYRGGGGGDGRRSRGYFTSTPYRGSGGRRGHVTTPANGTAADFIAGKYEVLEKEVLELRAAKIAAAEAPARKIRAGTLTEIEDLKRKLSKTRDALEREKSKNLKMQLDYKLRSATSGGDQIKKDCSRRVLKNIRPILGYGFSQKEYKQAIQLIFLKMKDETGWDAVLMLVRMLKGKDLIKKLLLGLQEYWEDYETEDDDSNHVEVEDTNHHYNSDRSSDEEG